uniref:Uncharacterized protein n=1 Tax=Anguilla anguilla TaxID=7936 RepID=A0A0E9TQL1_ANGAN
MLSACCVCVCVYESVNTLSWCLWMDVDNRG